jgi:hypothetical protein
MGGAFLAFILPFDDDRQVIRNCKSADSLPRHHFLFRAVLFFLARINERLFLNRYVGDFGKISALKKIRVTEMCGFIIVGYRIPREY